MVSAHRVVSDSPAEILPYIQLAAIDAPVTVVAVTLPPGIHPVAADGEAFAQIEFQSYVGDEEGIMEHVGLDRDACRGQRFGLHRQHDGVHFGGVFCPVTHEGIAFQTIRGVGLLFRFGRAMCQGIFHRDDRVPQFREEFARHVAPAFSAVQVHQLPLAPVDHDTAPHDPFGGVLQNVQHFLLVGHGRLLHLYP